MKSTLPLSLRTAGRTLVAALTLTAVLGLEANLLGGVPAQAHRLAVNTVKIVKAVEIVKDDATYSLKRIYKAGETDRYKMTTKANIDSPQLGAHDVDSMMLLREKTQEAKEDGAATSLSDFERAVFTIDGTETDITDKLPKILTTRNKSGQTDVKLDGGDPAIIDFLGDQVKQLTLTSASAFLLDKPVKVGDTWDINTANKGQQDDKIKGKVTLLSVDTVNGAKVAKLKMIKDVADNMNTKIHSETITLLDVATGKPLNVTTKSDGETAQGKLHVEMTMKKLTPGEKGDEKEAAKPAVGTEKKP